MLSLITRGLGGGSTHASKCAWMSLASNVASGNVRWGSNHNAAACAWLSLASNVASGNVRWGRTPNAAAVRGIAGGVGNAMRCLHGLLCGGVEPQTR